MRKQNAVASLGESALVRPARVREALRANDRLKVFLTTIQVAAAHAEAPDRPAVDLSREIAAAGIVDREESRWLRDLPASAAREDQALKLPAWPKLAGRMESDLAAMALPVLEEGDEGDVMGDRVAVWRQRLRDSSEDDRLADGLLGDLSGGGARDAPSLHRLVMDLHQCLNRLVERIGGEDVSGAHAWQIDDAAGDRACLDAFMHGVNRTRHLKMSHPGLETSATRDGDRLLIQNDIGTNDAHVLVLRVHALETTLTYSDLHRTRFEFFRSMLEDVGATWSAIESHATGAHAQEEAYLVGTATWKASNVPALHEQLEAIGSRLVFLIDWNRARKRLQEFVDKPAAIAALTEVARRETGHMAWLSCGGERLVWNAMAAQGEAMFRLGDRLDRVMGDEAARDWLVEVMVFAQQALERGQPAALVADEARILLARRVKRLRAGASLLQEHAAWCHALAQSLRDGLAHGVERDAKAAAHLAERAKGWERRADEIVVRARAQAAHQPRWVPFLHLVERSDDVADALEEAAFLLSVISECRHDHWGREVQEAMQSLADAVLAAVQDHVRVVALDLTVAAPPDGAGEDEALDALWRVLQAERQCDELLRQARRLLARHVREAALLQLGNEFAAALEMASDHLLSLGYGIRAQRLDSLETRA